MGRVGAVFFRFFFFFMSRLPPSSTLFPYTTLFRSMRKNYIRILTGDAVTVEMTPYDLTKGRIIRSEEHTSELQSRFDLVCRLLLEKKETRGGAAVLAGEDAEHRHHGAHRCQQDDHD